jgi:hypothetical protein
MRDDHLVNEMRRTFLAEIKSVVSRYINIPITTNVAKKINQVVQEIEEEQE